MDPADPVSPSLTVEEFWQWLLGHYNCLVRAGGPGFSLYDQPDLHWHLGEDRDGSCFALLMRGKETLGELTFSPADVQYVQPAPDGGDGDQTIFELVGETDEGTAPLCWFVLAHPYDVAATEPERWTH
jgi:hypothetical protein